jgi:hypothetical protein
MIVKHVGPYTLCQVKGGLTTSVYKDKQFVKKVLGCVLTGESAKAIVLETGR